MRYSCGHTACNSCVIDQEDCQICLAPPSSEPKPDDALTQRVKNASVLLQACEDLFNTDGKKYLTLAVCAIMFLT